MPVSSFSFPAHFGESVTHLSPMCSGFALHLWSASFCAPAALCREVPSVITGGAPSIGACGRDLLRAQPAQGERLPRPPLSPLPQKLASMVLRHCSLLRRLRVLFRPPLMRGCRLLRIAGFFWKFSVGIREDSPAL